MSKVSKPLPLFRLPTIPLTKISRYMDLQEIFMVSLASKKSALIIRSLLPPNLFSLKIVFSVESKATIGAEGHWIDPLVIKRKGVYGRPVARQFCDVCSQTIEQTVYSHSVEIIRRCDGKKATVKCGSRDFVFNVID
ncbi:hypothetical protein CRE_04244 [Caenorhabditis remanei]|uniref:F-box domain-containing protein n=1 Tax=Caenorhabditis remanei TaxID=31234 RepID=E3MYX3_CAERE|nr:hypothetical protein CRE_04244 [Caenorhabditis remanei]